MISDEPQRICVYVYNWDNPSVRTDGYVKHTYTATALKKIGTLQEPWFCRMTLGTS